MVNSGIARNAFTRKVALLLSPIILDAGLSISLSSLAITIDREGHVATERCLNIWSREKGHHAITDNIGRCVNLPREL